MIIEHTYKSRNMLRLLFKTTRFSISILFPVSILILSGCGDSGSDDQPPAGEGPLVESVTITGDFSGDDGLSVDNQGNVYVSNLASGSGTTIYKVTPQGASTVLSSELRAPMGHTFDASGNLLVSNDNSTAISQISPSGQLIEFINDPRFQGGSLAFGPDGNLYHSVYATDKIYKISPEKEITEIASGGTMDVPFGITVDDSNNVYVANFSDGRITKITPEGNTSLLVDVPSRIGYVVFANDKLYATGFSSNVIYEITLNGTLSTFAGDGRAGTVDAAASAASFIAPNGIGVDANGTTLYISQKNFALRKIALQ